MTLQRTEQVKRYGVTVRGTHTPKFSDGMREHESGEWVSFSDFEAKAAECERYRKALREIADLTFSKTPLEKYLVEVARIVLAALSGEDKNGGDDGKE